MKVLILDAYSVARKKLLFSIFSEEKTDLLGERGQHPQVPSTVGDSQLAIVVANQHKIIGWKYFSEPEPESTSTAQEPPVPTGAVS